MPRRGNVPKRETLPDPIYQSPLVTRLRTSSGASVYFGSGIESRFGTSPLRGMDRFPSLYFGRLAPYFERLWRRLATPDVSRVPRMM